MNARIPSLVLFLLVCAWPLRAEDSGVGNVVAHQAPPNSKPATDSPGQTTKVPPAILSAQEKSPPATSLNATVAGVEMPRVPARSGEDLMWLALLGATVISLTAIVFTWRTSRRNLAVPPLPARAETPVLLAPNLLPVISQAVKEALVQELAAQRRELMSSQQSAAAELAGLARRLEAVQAPLLERLGGLRSTGLAAAKFHREISVNIYCTCGQKFSFDVQPVDGRMPFPVACPACGQDGTPQANQIIARILNGITRPLPSPGGTTLSSSAPSGMTPQLADAVKQAVVKELAATRAAPPKAVSLPVVSENHNGGGPPENHAGNFVASLLVEGQSLAVAGELDKAAKCFEAALVFQPDHAEALVKMGGVLDKLDRADEALQYYDRAIALDESLTIAYLNKGGLFNRLARYDEALRCYEQALHKQKKSIT